VDPELIPALPEDITSLSDDELAELRTRLLDLEQKIYDADEETVGDASNAEVMAAYEQVVEAIRTLNTEQAKRGEEQQAVADKMTELRADVRDPEPEKAEEPEADKTDEAVSEDEEEVVEGEVVEAEPEPVLASSRPFRSKRVVRDEQPEPEQDSLSLVASSDVPGFSSGTPITRLQLAEALIAKRRAFVSAPEGYREQVVVATAITEYPEDRYIGDEDPLGDHKIRKAVGSPGSVEIEPLVAAGGICAPTDVRYAWDVLGSTSTPVWNSLPKFGAARGGIRFPVIPTIANITTATTTVTADQDAAGGTTAIKGCQEVTCPSFSEVLVDIVAACLQFPNLTARTYPEMVAGWNELLAIALAQEIESKILTSIQAGSTDVTDIAEGTTVPTDLGAIGQLYPVLLQAAARLRNNMRLDPNVALRALIPAWVLDVLTADYYRRHSVDPTAKAKNDFVTALNRIGIQPTFYLDGSAAGAQVMGAQTAAALVTYPALAEIFLYVEGTWLGLDGGQLDLGVVRDSTLNSTNKYQVFAEQFLNVAKVSGESVALRIPLGPTGAAALDKTTTFATSM
jgi:hypothetical protein